MKIGFTGTRRGMTPEQRDAFSQLLCTLPSLTEFHHGDCVGADDEAADIVHELDLHNESWGTGVSPHIRIVVHPPVDEAHRAFHPYGDEVLPAKTHFARNRDIVDQTDLLIACPCDMEHQPRGGTWYTFDYAKKRGKLVRLILPDGTVKEE